MRARPSLMIPAADFRINTKTVGTTAVKVAPASAKRAGIVFSMPGGGGTAAPPAAYPFVMLCPDPGVAINLGIRIDENNPRLQVDFEFFGAAVNAEWWALTGVGSHDITVFEYRWEPEKVFGELRERD